MRIASNTNIISLFQEQDLPAPQPAAEIDAAFEEFWKWFPRKTGKPLAKAKFKAIVTTGLKTKTLDRDSGSYVDIELSATAEELVSGVKAYVRSLTDMNTFKRKVEDKYLPYPASWLNQGRWMDE